MGDSIMGAGQFWRLERVKEETGICTAAIYAGMAEGTFPKNFPISKQARAWLSEEVEAWKAARLAARNTETVAAEREASAGRARANAAKANAGRRRKTDRNAEEAA
jgi:predicted DNA-binding transcriptional regulator AlpA